MKKTKLQILHTSDIHGYIYPYSYSSKKEENLGVARLSSLVQKLKNDDTLLIDSGDTIQGSPLTYYFSKEKDGINPMAKVFNHIGYDYVSIGNHEFNYGLKYLKQYLNHVDAKILNCNLLDKETQEPFKGITHDIVNHKDIKIGIIGVTTHYIPNWEQPSNIENIDILDAFESTKKMVSKLRNQVDFLIVNYHGGFERDFDSWELMVDDTGENQGSKILKEIDGIDLLLTGHQHRQLNGSKYNTYYSQPGCNAQMLSQIEIDFTIGDTITYEVVTNQLLSFAGIEPDIEIMNLVQQDEDDTQNFLDTPVGKMDVDLLIDDQLDARLHKHPLVSFINQVQMEYTGVQIASCSLGNSVSGFRKDITIRDVIGTYVYPNTMVVKRLSGKVLRQSLEKTAEFFDIKDNQIVISDDFTNPKLELYAYDMYDGIDYTIKVSNPRGNRIVHLSHNGKDIVDSEFYDVVMNNYRSAGGGDYTFIKESEVVNDTQTEVIELLIDYIVKNKNIKIIHSENIKVIK